MKKHGEKGSKKHSYERAPPSRTLIFRPRNDQYCIVKCIFKYNRNRPKTGAVNTVVLPGDATEWFLMKCVGLAFFYISSPSCQCCVVGFCGEKYYPVGELNTSETVVN